MTLYAVTRERVFHTLYVLVRVQKMHTRPHIFFSVRGTRNSDFGASFCKVFGPKSGATFRPHLTY